MKAGGAKAIWLVTAGLALLFLAVWSADQGTDQALPPQAPPGAEATPDQAKQQREKLSNLAVSDAASRVDSRARVEVDSATVQNFTGGDLRDASPADPGAQLGLVIILLATVDGHPVSKLTYHAVSPDRVVFVKQEAP